MIATVSHPAASVVGHLSEHAPAAKPGRSRATHPTERRLANFSLVAREADHAPATGGACSSIAAIPRPDARPARRHAHAFAHLWRQGGTGTHAVLRLETSLSKMSIPPRRAMATTAVCGWEQCTGKGHRQFVAQMIQNSRFRAKESAVQQPAKNPAKNSCAGDSSGTGALVQACCDPDLRWRIQCRCRCRTSFSSSRQH